jgi:hypothetical protein
MLFYIFCQRSKFVKWLFSATRPEARTGRLKALRGLAFPLMAICLSDYPETTETACREQIRIPNPQAETGCLATDGISVDNRRDAGRNFRSHAPVRLAFMWKRQARAKQSGQKRLQKKEMRGGGQQCCGTGGERRGRRSRR